VGCETIYTFIYRTAQAGQGSEYPAVIIPVLTHHYAMLQRNLLYTGVTRGKRLVVVVGQKKAVAIAVRTASGRRRSDWLSTKSIEALPA
jgi:exodeoxyribonuclease V alpha subunit